MEQQGVSAPTSYFSQDGVAFNASNVLELIITQKWIANYQANGFSRIGSRAHTIICA